MAFPAVPDRYRFAATLYVTFCGVIYAAFAFIAMYQIGKVDLPPGTPEIYRTLPLSLGLFLFMAIGYFWPIMAPAMQRIRMGWLRYWAIFTLVMQIVVAAVILIDLMLSLNWLGVILLAPISAGAVFALLLNLNR